MQNITAYFHPNPPQAEQPLTIHLDGDICE